MSRGSAGARSFSPNQGARSVGSPAAVEGVAEWTYRFRPLAHGTDVEETWRIIRDDERITGLPDEQLKGLLSMTERGIETTLANLKKIAEA